MAAPRTATTEAATSAAARTAAETASTTSETAAASTETAASTKAAAAKSTAAARGTRPTTVGRVIPERAPRRGRRGWGTTPAVQHGTEQKARAERWAAAGIIIAAVVPAARPAEYTYKDNNNHEKSKQAHYGVNIHVRFRRGRMPTRAAGIAHISCIAGCEIGRASCRERV